MIAKSQVGQDGGAYEIPRPDPAAPPPASSAGPNKAPPHTPLPGDTEAKLNLTDTGNAERYVLLTHGNLRFCHSWKQWMTWDKSCWGTDETGLALYSTKAVINSLYAEGGRCEEGDIRDAALVWAKSSEKADRRKAMVELAKSERGMSIAPAQLDTHPNLLNCANGTLDLDTGDFREHRRDDHLTKRCPTRYMPDAKCPVFEAFLERVLPDDDVRAFLQRWIGYCLTGYVSEQVLLVLLGDGANGKSTLVSILQHVLSPAYAIQIASDLLIAKNARNHPTEIADLFGVRIAFGIETGKDQSFDEPLIKQLTGSDRIRARRMREDFWEFDPTHKIVLVTNHMPTIEGTDHAIWRRLLVVRFEVTIPPEERDKNLFKKLRGEREGILLWAIRGCREWANKGLQVPESVIYRRVEKAPSQSVSERFIDAMLRRKLGSKTSAAELLQRAERWCQQHEYVAPNARELGMALGAKGYGSKRLREGITYLDVVIAEPPVKDVKEDEGGSALNSLEVPRDEVNAGDGSQGSHPSPPPKTDASNRVPGEVL